MHLLKWVSYYQDFSSEMGTQSTTVNNQTKEILPCRVHCRPFNVMRLPVARRPGEVGRAAHRTIGK